MNGFRQKGRIFVYFLGFISVLLVVLFMGEIKPRDEPRTIVAFDFSTLSPRVRITNLEAGDQNYHLIIYGEGGNNRISQQLHLDKHQTVDLDLPQSSLSLPSQGKIYLDLYIEGQDKPYRSIYFLQGVTTTVSQYIPKEVQGN